MFNILSVTKYSYLDCIQILFDCLLTKFIDILMIGQTQKCGLNYIKKKWNFLPLLSVHTYMYVQHFCSVYLHSLVSAFYIILSSWHVGVSISKTALNFIILLFYIFLIYLRRILSTIQRMQIVQVGRSFTFNSFQTLYIYYYALGDKSRNDTGFIYIYILHDFITRSSGTCPNWIIIEKKKLE